MRSISNRASSAESVEGVGESVDMMNAGYVQWEEQVLWRYYVPVVRGASWRSAVDIPNNAQTPSLHDDNFDRFDSFVQGPRHSTKSKKVSLVCLFLHSFILCQLFETVVSFHYGKQSNNKEICAN
jgi:hypothetical protein